MEIKFEAITVQKPEEYNIIIGQAHFIKTVEDLYETLAEAGPQIKFGVAFCESSGKRLIRVEGNDQQLKQCAADNAAAVGCGHMFVIVLKDAFPVNVLNRVKSVSEVCTIFCATANPVQVIVAVTAQGRAFLGVVDGSAPAGVEKEEDVAWRKNLLRKIGYKK